MKIKDLQRAVIKFRDERNWKQFHHPKNTSVHLILEAAELLELFQYKDEKELAKFVKTHKEDISDELSDVLYWVLLMSYDLKIDIENAFMKKLTKNEKKYPIEKARGSRKKYTEL